LGFLSPPAATRKHRDQQEQDQHAGGGCDQDGDVIVDEIAEAGEGHGFGPDYRRLSASAA
jgi:hypothetical protein